MLHLETFGVRKDILNFSLAKPGYRAEKILTAFELYIYGDTVYISSSFSRNVLKIAVKCIS
jgi:hypothetical protein